MDSGMFSISRFRGIKNYAQQHKFLYVTTFFSHIKGIFPDQYKAFTPALNFNSSTWPLSWTGSCYLTIHPLKPLGWLPFLVFMNTLQ